MTDIRVHPLGRRRGDDEFEVVERKGEGHPDTLADALAEELSRTYANHTLERFGAVLHHQFDKVGILGGSSEVRLGESRMVRPVRVLLNGRATARFADEHVHVEELLRDATRAFFESRFPMLRYDRDVRVIWEVSQNASPGAVDREKGTRARWFHPRSLDDLPNIRDPRCNDTSSGCGYTSLTALEEMVLGIEGHIQGGFRSDRPEWLGTDIKIMAVRTGREVALTIALPQMGAHVPDVASYRSNIDWAVTRLLEFHRDRFPELVTTIRVNTRDDFDVPELYLTHTGSSMEAGDEGLVGRGNRMGGLIAASRPYTMEGISGKNPVYHTGKMYCVGATEMSAAIQRATGLGAEVTLVGQSGRSLTNPWQTLITVEAEVGRAAAAREGILVAAKESLEKFPDYTHKLLAGKYRLS